MIGADDLCLSWIHKGTVRAEFMDSVLGLLAHPLTTKLISRYETFGGGTHAQARNQVAAQFLGRGDQGWLLMLDTDLVFHPSVVHHLAVTADPQTQPIVTGLYWNTYHGSPRELVPMIYDRHASGGFVACHDWEPGSIFRVDGCGAGLLLVHRSALEAIGGDWFTEIGEAGQPGRYGEDLSFCLRAARAGIPLHADTAALAGHLKTVTIRPGGAGNGKATGFAASTGQIT